MNAQATPAPKELHPLVVTRSGINSGSFYTLWQMLPSGYWVTERTFGGAHLKGDDSYWNGEVTKNTDWGRTTGFFQSGIDPNQKEETS